MDFLLLFIRFLETESKWKEATQSARLLLLSHLLFYFETNFNKSEKKAKTVDGQKSITLLVANQKVFQQRGFKNFAFLL